MGHASWTRPAFCAISKMKKGRFVVYLGSIVVYSVNGIYEMGAERRIAAGNRVNGVLAALMRRKKDECCVRMKKNVLSWFRHE